MIKKIIYISLYIILFNLKLPLLAAYTGSIHGTITDKTTHEPLPGVTVYLPDLKTGTTTDQDGNYSFRNLPAVPVLFQLSYVSYRTVVEWIDLSVNEEYDFEMEYAATEINEVIVTGVGRSTEQKRNPAPVTVISKASLLSNTASNLVDAIASQPGLSQITTGSGISKPVIRGLSYNRVVIVHEGVRQENQQWGDEHGLEIDEYGVDRVEVLKGPASLAYGSDALAGVINLLPAPFEADGKVRASLTAGYQGNNGLTAISADVAGNRKGTLWDVRLSQKLAHAYRNRVDGYVLNSGFRQSDIGLMTGLIRSWGYVSLTADVSHLKPGIVEGERDSVTGNFVYPEVLPDGTITYAIAGKGRLRSYTSGIPYQDIVHLKSVLTGNLYLGKTNLRLTLGGQQNRRQEFADPEDPGTSGLYFLLNTLNYDVRLNTREYGNFSASAGINGMWQKSSNLGSEFLVPAYGLWDGGLYGIIRLKKGIADITGGLRYDIRQVTSHSLWLDADGNPVQTPKPGSSARFEAFHADFGGLSASLGTSLQVTRTLYSKLNISRGFRTPNIAEMGSNGIHEGTSRYETGNPQLKPEISTQADFSQGWNSEHISAEVNLFAGTISNYIFQRKIQSETGLDSLTEGAETFRYVSGSAFLTGGEIRFDIHPHPYDFIHFENTFSWVRGTLPDGPAGGRYLPMIPPARFKSSLRVELKEFRFAKNAYVSAEVEQHFRQDHVYVLYGTETPTPAYTLLHMGLGGDIVNHGKTLLSVYIHITNLANTPYQSHLSRLKYLPANETTGRNGVYNMGRNIGIRIIIPFVK